MYRVSDDASQVETIGARQADPAVQSFDVDHFTIYVATGSNYASTGIKLDSSSIEVGETIKALGERKWNSKGYSWTSSDASVAKVAFSKENRADIVGVSPGVATITYSYKVAIERIPTPPKCTSFRRSSSTRYRGTSMAMFPKARRCETGRYPAMEGLLIVQAIGSTSSLLVGQQLPTRKII